jgi:hypothetical protein
MQCGEVIANGSSFCRMHDGDPLLKSKVLRDLRWAFECAAPAILNQPVP